MMLVVRVPCTVVKATETHAILKSQEINWVFIFNPVFCHIIFFFVFIVCFFDDIRKECFERGTSCSAFSGVGKKDLCEHQNNGIGGNGIFLFCWAHYVLFFFVKDVSFWNREINVIKKICVVRILLDRSVITLIMVCVILYGFHSFI
jgi:hypothetical protein